MQCRNPQQKVPQGASQLHSQRNSQRKSQRSGSLNFRRSQSEFMSVAWEPEVQWRQSLIASDGRLNMLLTGLESLLEQNGASPVPSVLREDPIQIYETE